MPKHTTTQLAAEFSIVNWDEQPIVDDTGNGKLTRAVVEKTYSGDVDGHSTTEWLMAYAGDGSATFVGMEHLDGTIGGRKGAVVLRHVGSYADGVATAELTITPGSGSGQLAGAEGSGSLRADPSGKVELQLSTG
jgi:hypothetical protein